MSAQIESILGQAFFVSYKRALDPQYISVGSRIVGLVRVEEFLVGLEIRVKVDRPVCVVRATIR
jgi:hypothetical protein